MWLYTRKLHACVATCLGLLRQVGAARVHEVDARQPVLHGNLLGSQVFLHCDREIGSTLDCGIVSYDDTFLPDAQHNKVKHLCRSDVGPDMDVPFYSAYASDKTATIDLFALQWKELSCVCILEQALQCTGYRSMPASCENSRNADLTNTHNVSNQDIKHLHLLRPTLDRSTC